MAQLPAESLQPTWRVWGEEREPEVIFTVYLKKVRYHRPTSTVSTVSGPKDASHSAKDLTDTDASTAADDDISHLEWETIRVRFVKAATLRRLVEALTTDDGELDTTFVSVFLATYRTFARPDEVLDLLLERYERLYVELPILPASAPVAGEPPATASSSSSSTDTISDHHKESLITALHIWLDRYPEDWTQQNLQKIVAFTSHRLSSSEIHYKLLNRLDQVVRDRAAAQQLSNWHQTQAVEHDEHQSRHHHHHAHHPPSHRGCHHSGSTHNGSGGLLATGDEYIDHATLMYESLTKSHHQQPHHHHHTSHHYPHNQHSNLQGKYVRFLSEQMHHLQPPPTAPHPHSHHQHHPHSHPHHHHHHHHHHSSHLPPLLQHFGHLGAGDQHHFTDTYGFFASVTPAHFAAQLTRYDVRLFKRLLPHQCLGATWARRDKDKKGVHTVLATIDQFNAVLFAVISSVLLDLNARPAERAAHISTWIDIAKELRVLKNFSSLKAIVSGLQAEPLYRLRRTWEALDRGQQEVYEELAAIFSQEDNEGMHRDVMMREGTAKFAVTARETDRHLNKFLQKQNPATSYGTIPYLGIFLFDLTMIHTAIAETVPAPEGAPPGQVYINFDKKRKEFEVLAQIKLLQGAANAYRLEEDAMFDRWFAGFPVLTEAQAHDRSCKLEPPPEPSSKQTSANASAAAAAAVAAATSAAGAGYSAKLFGHRKSASIASTSSSGAGSQDIALLSSGDATTTTAKASRNNSLDRQSQPVGNGGDASLLLLSTTSSMSSLSIESGASSGLQLNGGRSAATATAAVQPMISANAISKIAPPIVNGQLHQTDAQKAGGDTNVLIIRVSLKTAQTPADGVLQYKSIMLNNSDRTSHVIRNAMDKLDLTGDADEWTLVYCLPDNEMVIQPNTNVFYAVDKRLSLNFMLHPKTGGKWENLI